MADFKKFLTFLLNNEGGLVNDPADPGGLTNKGITLRTFKVYGRSILGVEATPANLANLTNDQAGRIYKREYWDTVFGDEIQHELLAFMLADFHVNAGYQATLVFLKVLNSFGSNHPPSGRLTRKIMDSLSYHDPDEIYMEYKRARIAYYHSLAQEHPAFRRYLHGWIRRVNELQDVKVPGRPDLTC
jgi:lysozyme family protein